MNVYKMRKANSGDIPEMVALYADTLKDTVNIAEVSEAIRPVISECINNGIIIAVECDRAIIAFIAARYPKAITGTLYEHVVDISSCPDAIAQVEMLVIHPDFADAILTTILITNLEIEIYRKINRIAIAVTVGQRNTVQELAECRYSIGGVLCKGNDTKYIMIKDLRCKEIC